MRRNRSILFLLASAFILALWSCTDEASGSHESEEQALRAQSSLTELKELALWNVAKDRRYPRMDSTRWSTCSLLAVLQTDTLTAPELKSVLFGAAPAVNRSNCAAYDSLLYATARWVALDSIVMLLPPEQAALVYISINYGSGVYREKYYLRRGSQAVGLRAVELGRWFIDSVTIWGRVTT
jgi:hypothetical protein